MTRLAPRSIMQLVDRLHFTFLHRWNCHCCHRHHLRRRHLRAQIALHYHHLRRRHLWAQTALFRYHMYVGVGRLEPPTKRLECPPITITPTHHGLQCSVMLPSRGKFTIRGIQDHIIIRRCVNAFTKGIGSWYQKQNIFMWYALSWIVALDDNEFKYNQ